MPRLLSRQESGPESQENVFGDGVPHNGVDGQAVRRAHMQEQTTARQAAERRLEHDRIPLWDHEHRALVAARVVEVRAELALINAAHQTWLRAHGGEV